MTITLNEKYLNNEQFEELAVPYSWYLVADELHEQAMYLFKSKGQRFVKYFDPANSKNSPIHTDMANRACFLLAGFALENIIKAYLVYEHPEWISGGKLSKEIKTHSLCDLASMSSLLPWQVKGRTVLKAFESGLDSWARYPCPSNVNTWRPELYFTDILWENYQKQMSRYRKELKSLLTKNWKGPHKHDGCYSFQGDF